MHKIIISIVDQKVSHYQVNIIIGVKPWRFDYICRQIKVSIYIAL